MHSKGWKRIFGPLQIFSSRPTEMGRRPKMIPFLLSLPNRVRVLCTDSVGKIYALRYHSAIGEKRIPISCPLHERSYGQFMTIRGWRIDFYNIQYGQNRRDRSRGPRPSNLWQSMLPSMLQSLKPRSFQKGDINRRSNYSGIKKHDKARKAWQAA